MERLSMRNDNRAILQCLGFLAVCLSMFGVLLLLLFSEESEYWKILGFIGFCSLLASINMVWDDE